MSYTTQEIVDRHGAAFGAGDMDAILEDYSDDIIFLTPMGVIDNKAGVREVFVGLFAEFGKPGVTFDVTHVGVKGDVALMTWTAETPDNSYEFGTDTLIVRDGKIVHQTFCGKIVAKG